MPNFWFVDEKYSKSVKYRKG